MTWNFVFPEYLKAGWLGCKYPSGDSNQESMKFESSTSLLKKNVKNKNVKNSFSQGFIWGVHTK